VRSHGKVVVDGGRGAHRGERPLASWRSLRKERQRPPASALRASILSVYLFFIFAFLFLWERHKTSPTEMGADRSDRNPC
jgi:hypothetical protein